MTAPDTNPQWHFKHGSYYLYGPTGDILWMTGRVAVAYEMVGDEPVLMKHGPPEVVTKWAEDAVAKYREARFEPELGVLMFPRGFPVEEINRCISTVGYLATVMERVEKEPGDGYRRSATED